MYKSAYDAKGRGFEFPRRLSFERRVYREVERRRKARSEAELVKGEDRRWTAKAIKSGMATRSDLFGFVSKTIKWLMPSKERHGKKI